MDPNNQLPTNQEKRQANESLYGSEVPFHLRDRFTAQQWESLTYEQKDLLQDLEHLPKSLTGVVPESVWETLSNDQRLEFLFTHELIPMTGDLVPSSPEDQKYQEFSDQLLGTEKEEANSSAEDKLGFMESSKKFDRLKEEVREIEVKSREKERSVEGEQNEEFIQPEDVDRIQAESGATFSQSTMPRFAGYQPDDQFLSQIDQNLDGSPRKSNTWTANIIKKIWVSLSSQ